MVTINHRKTRETEDKQRRRSPVVPLNIPSFTARVRKTCREGSRLWNDSLVLPPASSRYPANATAGPRWIKADLWACIYICVLCPGCGKGGNELPLNWKTHKKVPKPVRIPAIFPMSHRGMSRARNTRRNRSFPR